MYRLSSNLEGLLEAQARVLVPSTQRALALRLAYAGAQLARGRTAWASPRISTWRAWLESEARRSGGDRRVLPELEEWLLWRECAQRAWNGEGEPAAILIDALQRSAGLVFEWGISLSSLQATPEGDWLLRAIRLCDTACAARGAQARYRLATLFERVSAGGSLHAVRVHLAGFGQLSAAQRALLDSGAAARIESGAGDRSDATICRGVLAPDPTAEIALAAQWARERLDAQPDAHLLVLLPELRQREPEVLRVFARTLCPRGALAAAPATQRAAIEGGHALHGFAAVAMRLAAIRPPDAVLPLAELLGWLRAIGHEVAADPAAAQLDVWLRGVLEPEVSLALFGAALARAPLALRSAARTLQARLEAIQTLPWSQIVPLAEWCARFRKLWDVLDPPSQSRRGSAEQQTLARFAALLDELAASVTRNLDGPAAAALIAAVAARTRFDPATGDTPVTLSSALSDPIVRYHGIWAAGLDAETWPASPQPDPFIPVAVQRAAGLPQASAASLAQQAIASMRHWSAATPELVLSRAQFRDGAERESSALVDAMLRNARSGTASTTLAPLEQPRLAPSLAERRRGLTGQESSLHLEQTFLERFEDVDVVPWPDPAAIPHGARTLELQAHCAFRAYAQLRLHADPLETRAPGIDPRERGRFLHRALEALWRDFGSGAGLHAARDHWDIAIGRALEIAAMELGWNEPTHAAFRHRQRERRRVAALLRALCEFDARRPEFLDVRCETQAAVELAWDPLESTCRHASLSIL